MKDKKLTRLFKGREELSKYPIVASLDMHDSNIYMVCADIDKGELYFDRNILGGKKAVLKQLNKVGNKKKMLVLYESGNQGFAPYRFFTKAGYSCRVIASSSIPKRGKQQKTDRDDAINNLHYHTSELLRYVNIPDEVDEDARECLRFRYEQVWHISKEKQKILSLVKRQGRVFELTKSNWTRAHYRWLKDLVLMPCSRTVLDMYLKRLRDLESRLTELDTLLDRIFSENLRYRRLKTFYMLLPGIGRVGSMTFVLEGRDLGRFSSALSLMSYTGLIPKKDASGPNDPERRITKAGNKFLRLSAVCAAKYYRDRRTLLSNDRINELPLPLRVFLEKCQKRLYTRYRYLRKKGKHGNKAKVAIARELCGFLWELSEKVMPKLDNFDIYPLAA